MNHSSYLISIREAAEKAYRDGKSHGKVCGMLRAAEICAKRSKIMEDAGQIDRSLEAAQCYANIVDESNGG